MKLISIVGAMLLAAVSVLEMPGSGRAAAAAESPHPHAGTVFVQTVPPTPGVTFTLDGATISTGLDGQASGVVANLDGVWGRLQLASPEAGPDRVSLLRVARVPVRARYQRHLVADIQVQRAVTLTFHGPGVRILSPSRVTTVELSGARTRFNLTGQQSQSIWLPAAVGTRRHRVWQTRQFTYAVSLVRVDGGNVVFSGQQRFNPNVSTQWSVKTGVFDVGVTVKDVLFGSSVASTVWITKPDGSRHQVYTGRSAKVVRVLARGSYDFDVDAAVLGSHSTVLVSRTESVDIRVVTVLDMVVFFLVTVSFMACVILVGWWSRRVRSRRVPAP